MVKRVTYILLIVCLFCIQLSAADYEVAEKVNLNDLIDATQLSNDDPDEISIAWWLPTEFWVASFQDEQGTSQAEIDNIKELFDPYVMMIVLKGTIGPFGGITYLSEQEILSTLELVDQEDNHYYPVIETNLDDNLKIMVSAVRPMLTNMLGNLGENMNVAFFSALNSNQEKYIDISSDGYFKVLFSEEEYIFDLPIVATLKEKECSECKRNLPGNFFFCPFDGKKLK